MGQFASFADFLAMGKHGLYVWLSYGIFLAIILYNVISVVINQRLFFKDAKRRLRREQNS
ncbi:MAG: heme exporter protein CcmD [Methylococcaceae bacterium]|nr:heme exporter protein CcmD [Methylococcaceae bacterium]